MKSPHGQAYLSPPDDSLSIIVPSFNEAATLEEAVRRLQAVPLPIDTEIILVDDGSVDGSAELLDDRAAADPRLVVHHGPPRGVAGALQAAVGLARAPLLARMDADDVSHPERLARQVTYLDAHPEVDLVSCRAEPVDGPVGSGTRRLFDWQNGLLDHDAMVADLFVDAPFPHDSVVLRRDALARAGGYREVPWPEGPIAVQCAVPAGQTVEAVDWLYPEMGEPLSLDFFELEGRVEFTIPQLIVYGMSVLRLKGC